MKKANLLLYGVPALIVIGLIVLVATAPKEIAPPDRSVNQMVLDACIQHTNIDLHIHPLLTIMINGVRQEIPSDIGITPSCMSPLHTHDNTGKIHVEYVTAKDFTIGHFFQIWGKTFNQNQILDSVVDETHQLRFTVNGVENTDYENYVVRDGDDIVISYETK